MPRRKRVTLAANAFAVLFVCACSWLFVPFVIIYDLIKARTHNKRFNLAFYYFIFWFLICAAVFGYFAKIHSQNHHTLLDALIFLAAPGTWFLFRTLFDYQAPFTTGKNFYRSKRWQRLRYLTLRKFGRVCMLCGATEGQMHVDHIKPRSKYPHLAFDAKNLQVLCAECNKAKSNVYEDDFRKTHSKSGS